jgi:uncharacterized protein YndB with AHSA1/START domain
MITDRIEKTVVLQAPQQRVWNALVDSSKFGLWFGAKFDGPFVAGTRVRGVIVGTTVNDKVAALQKPHEGRQFEFAVEKIEPERLLSFRWHPHAVDRAADYRAEPTTLIEFTLTAVAGGTQLTVTESGFDQIPLERRATAYEANSSGWDMQMQLIEAYLERSA